MHDTAKDIGRLFFEIYARPGNLIVELGSLDVNGSLREVCSKELTYIGLDIEPGPGVDAVIEQGSFLPLKSEIADIVVSSSTFEHDLFFWQTFLELARITRPGGVIYINAPSNGWYHRYPMDNWRFYPDAGKALARWATNRGYDLTLIESFVADRKTDVWNDFVATFKKGTVRNPRDMSFLFPHVPCTNVWHVGNNKVENERGAPEDMLLVQRLQGEIAQLRRELNAKANLSERRPDNRNNSLWGRLRGFLKTRFRD